MDTETIPPRSPAQAAASKVNGARSAGPTSEAGKAIASMNGVTHGLATRAALLPSERAEDYEAHLHGWLATLRPRTPGEGQVVARVADVGFRLERLARMEERLANRALETRLGDSGAAKALRTAREALQGLQGLAALAEGVARPVDATAVEKLVPGMRFVAKLLDETDAPVGVCAVLEGAITALADAADEVAPELFARVALAARRAETVLAQMVPELETAVETERARLADEVLLGDGEDAKLLDRHRARLHRELQAHLSVLKAVRELVVLGEDDAPVMQVEVRLVGLREDPEPVASGGAT
jgi:hypothetical protein